MFIVHKKPMEKHMGNLLLCQKRVPHAHPENQLDISLALIPISNAPISQAPIPLAETDRAVLISNAPIGSLHFPPYSAPIPPG